MYSTPVLTIICIAFPILTVPYGEVSEKMCKKYSAAVYVTEPDLGMSSSSGFNNVSECGMVSVPLIIGGKEATEKEFPHFLTTNLANTVKKLTFCYNTLCNINKYAFSPSSGPAQKVRLGMINLDNETDEDDNTIQEEIIRRFIVHPKFKSLKKYNDIALVELQRPVKFTPFVRPACLNIKPTTETKAIAIGFGKTSVDYDEGSQVLMKVTLDLILSENCSEYFPPKPRMENGVVSSMICAGVLEGGRDTCQGDSGGPLQIILDNPYCMYSIIGITSFGAFCGYANSPAIYSNVSYFVSWIEETVWKNT
ncbi:trypsin [Holotrichia oblita]|uniref:Trypsin n=1 Tax=Holotrichia oblita TaxID=644536 RepID=A0ACB9SXX3_HOLOL|nr:trypsin [Holotrichia oblita]